MPYTSPILFPSGEDVNPLHKRLPAEVVTRKRRPEPKVVEEKPVEEVEVDLKVAAALKPDARLKWLNKACKMAAEGLASTTDLYNIITSRKFLGGLPSRIARRLRDVVNENVDLFSEKQQRYLKSEDWSLNARFAEKADDVDGPREDDQDDFEDVPREDERPPDKPAERPPDKPPEKRQPEKLSDRMAEPLAERAPEKQKPRNTTRVEPEEPGQWVTASAARGQEDRVSREAAIKEEREKRRKDKERAEQERWMEVEAEASRKRSQEQQEAKRRQLEDEADSSMMLLESLGSSRPAASTESARERPVERGRRGGLSRSRSVKMRSRSRRRDRRRRRSASASRPRVDFADALKARMKERERNDTTRIPVVDPGHAARWASRDPQG